MKIITLNLLDEDAERLERILLSCKPANKEQEDLINEIVDYIDYRLYSNDSFKED